MVENSSTEEKDPAGLIRCSEESEESAKWHNLRCGCVLDGFLPPNMIKHVEAFISGSSISIRKPGSEGILPNNQNYRPFEYLKGSNQPVRVDSGFSHHVRTMCDLFSNVDIVPCCYDYNAEMKVGNVRQQRFTEVWNGPAYREFRKENISTKNPRLIHRV
ncbi:Iron-sulfur cluster-binding domain protein [uncultured archaeon]|nr:Iron-sulfur cluster-binding domain protein [uncultured archaeon]